MSIKIRFLFILIFIPFFVMAQNIAVKGVVKDVDGETMPGVIVTTLDSKIGTATNADGEFSISVPANTILKFALISYERQSLLAKPSMVVVMKEEFTLLNEVVVTGMVRTDKRMFTGATDKLSAADIKLDGVADASRLLEGRSAGVSVQNVSATFGTAPKIRVRGATSIFGNSKPLWVVDGIIIEDVTEISSDQLSSGDAVTLISSAIAGLNPDDIESFQILKDGSATSIYGARAMAGVIVITTKKGGKGATSINFTTELTTRMIPNYRDYNIMNSQDQMSLFRDMEEKGWLKYSQLYNAPHSGEYGRMYKLINSTNADTQEFGLLNTEQSRNSFLRAAEYRNTDWFEELFSQAVMQNYAVSVSSGNDRSTSYTSMSAMLDPGWTKQSAVKRYTVNTNNSYKFYDFLTYRMLANASFRDQRAPGTVTQETDAVSGAIRRDFDINPFNFATSTSRTLSPTEYYRRDYAPFNVLEELENNYIDLKVVDLKFQNELKWDIKKGWDVAFLGAMRYQTTAQQYIVKDNSNQANAYRAMDNATIREGNQLLYKDPDQPNMLPITILDVGGFYEKREYRMLSYDARLSTNWSKAIEDHFMTAFGGLEYNASDRTNDWFRGMGMQFANGELPFYNHLAFKKLSETNAGYFSLRNTRKRNIAYFTNLAYSYDRRYTFNGTFRHEGTNRLGQADGARWLPTWNVSGAWNAHEEAFLKPYEDKISNLTFRASYSLTADVGPEDVTNSRAIITSYQPWRPNANTQETGLQIDQLENSELTYEKKHELNIGLDLGLLKNRINLTIDWYTRNNFDLIGFVSTQGAGGQALKKANVASMKSHGIETTLSTKNMDQGGFKWNTDFTFSYSKNEITDLKSDTRVLDLITGAGFAREGYPVRGLFSIPFAGLDNEGLPMYNLYGKVIDKYSYSEINLQERGEVAASNLKYEGPSDPPISGGLGNVFTYKNVRLNVFVSYSFGNKIRLNPLFSYFEWNDYNAVQKEMANRWMMPGDELLTDVPTIYGSRQTNQYGSRELKRAYNVYNYSDARIADGGFIRLKDISLSYDFPKTMISKAKLQAVSVKIQATNLLLLYADSKLNGQDPEYYGSGGVSMPTPKQFTLSLRFGF